MSGPPFTRILALDFETRWCTKTGYTLSKMTTEEYIRHDRFKAFGASAHFLDDPNPIQWVRGDDLPAFFETIDWSSTAVLAHNAQFDATILSWRYGHLPCFILDTLSMARAVRGVEVGNSLDKLAKAYDLPPKGRALHSTDGLDELTPEIERELADYCNHDVWLAEALFKRLAVGYPAKELRLIDLTMRMYVRPLLQLDRSMLVDAIHEEKEKREGLLAKLGVDETVLASNDQFADLLQTLGVDPPTKVSRTTGKTTWAFAKNDAHFTALANGPDENVALLCEARLKVKSTIARTRAQRFHDIAHRGALPVPLSYFGAGTGRWTASKGSAINMQNLNRGSFLRKAIMAPEGHELVVGDLSQIEPRVLAWLADYEEVLDIFRSGKDVYATFGAQLFGIPGMTKESHPDLRQAAKNALLGCFGSETKVLTRRGWVPIIQVQATDTVWDGEEWVQHHGVVPQGEKEVLTALGISATSDHEILTGPSWAAWSEVLANPCLLASATSSARLPVLDGGAEAIVSIQPCGAHVVGRASWTATTSLLGDRPGVIAAQNARRWSGDGSKKATSPFAQITRIVSDYSTALARSSRAAPTRIQRSIQITAGAALRSTRRGFETAFGFFNTLSPSMGGTGPNCNWTASTTIKDMNPATCVSPRVAPTWPTNGASQPAKWRRSSGVLPILRQRMQTYDLAYCGPRNRYTILTDAGPLVVHNCGYGLGWAKFAPQLLVGFMGAPPVRYDKAFAKQLGVTAEDVIRFLDWDENVKKLQEMPHTCTMGELIIHCVATKAIIDKYRATAREVVAFWDTMGELIESSLYRGREVQYKCLKFRKEQIELPSGMPMNYPNLRFELDERGRKQWLYDGYKNGHPVVIKLYGGKVTNNVTQGTARCVMTDGMLRTARRYPVVGTVHDEQIVVVPRHEVEQARPWVLAQMVVEPPYMPGIPLAASGGSHRRYGLAKD